MLQKQKVPCHYFHIRILLNVNVSKNVSRYVVRKPRQSLPDLECLRALEVAENLA